MDATVEVVGAGGVEWPNSHITFKLVALISFQEKLVRKLLESGRESPT
jgi:hypothetical protein